MNLRRRLERLEKVDRRRQRGGSVSSREMTDKELAALVAKGTAFAVEQVAAMTGQESLTLAQSREPRGNVAAVAAEHSFANGQDRLLNVRSPGKRLALG